MRFVDSSHSPGTIVVPMGSLARFDEFYTSLEQTQVPHGTVLLKSRSAEIAYGLNSMIRRMQGDWVWILGDDHVWAPDLLLRLLDRQSPAIIPVVSSRIAPFVPVIWHGPIETRTRYTWEEVWALNAEFPLPFGDVCGNAGLLVRKSVLSEISDPWFEVGKVQPDCLHEDIHFAYKCGLRGIPIYIDCGLKMGHTTVVTVWPDQSIGCGTGVYLDVGSDRYPVRVFV